jgi:predicted O-linked N-acetylglucosamine transferase (SPINDLY family)
MNPGVIETWARVLQAVPGSRLLLKHGSFDKKSMADNIYSAFGAHGVARERLMLSGFEATTKEHLCRYHEVDIALDPFPYNGTTTSLEALWMGVPVITLAGEKHVSRVGVSQMSNLGYPEWIADDCDQYVAIAMELASDLEKLMSIRTGLRNKMSDSPLMDSQTLVKELEQKFLEIWSEKALS